MENHIHELMKYFKVHKKKLVLVCLIIMLNNALVIATGYFSKIIIDTLIPQSNWIGLLCLLSIAVPMLILLRFLLKARISLLMKIVNEVSFNLRKDYFKNIQLLGYSDLSKTEYAKIHTNLITDTEELTGNIIAFIDSASEVLFFVMTFIVLFFINYIITTALLIYCIVIYLIIFLLGKKMEKRRAAFAESNSNVNGSLDNYLEGIKDIILCNADKFFLKYTDTANEDFLKKRLAFNVFLIYIQALVDFSVVLSYTIIFLLSGFLYNKGVTTPGQIITYLVFIPQLWSRYISAINIFTNFLNIKIYSKRLFDNMREIIARKDKKYLLADDDDTGIDKSEGIYNSNMPISIDIHNISFSFDKDKYIFKDFSLNISQPGVYCISGSSGAGKTTLFNLLLKIFRVQKGSIKINGKEIELLKSDELRTSISIVHQNIFLINDTIMNNIIFGDSSISEKDIIKISEDIGFHKYLSRLPQGYNTIISNGENAISRGQLRLVTILRALCRNPDILLLDEITSNVDSYTNLLIHKFLDSISDKKICLFITHKKSDYKESYGLISIR